MCRCSHTIFFFFLIDATTLQVLVRSTIVLHESLSNTLLFQFLIFIFCKSILTSSSHLFFSLPFSLEASGFHLQILVTPLSFGILSMWPNHFSLWDLINLTIFFRLISSSSSSLVLIFHRPFTSLVGPKIFLNMFLS